MSWPSFNNAEMPHNVFVKMTASLEATEEAKRSDTCDINMCNSEMAIMVQDAYNRHIMQEMIDIAYMHRRASGPA